MHLQNQNYQKDPEDENEVIDHPDLRRLVDILSQRQFMESKFSNIIERNMEKIEERDVFLKILSLSTKFSIFDLIKQAEDSKSFFEQPVLLQYKFSKIIRLFKQ